MLGTASAGKHEFLRSVGVDEPIDYRSVDFTEAVKDVDIVIDTICGDYGPRSLTVLRPGGVLVSLVLSNLADTDADGIRTEAMLVEPDHHAMTQIAARAEAGTLRACSEGARTRRYGPGHGEDRLDRLGSTRAAAHDARCLGGRARPALRPA